MAGSVTALAKLGIGASDPVDFGLNFTTFDPGVKRTLHDANGTRGTFWKDGNRFSEDRTIVAPRLSTEPTAPELAKILAWVMGGTPTGSTTITYPWSDTPASRNVHFKPKAGEEWFLGNVAVDQCTLSAQTGGGLTCDIDMVGQTYSSTRTDFPAITYDQTLQPFLLSKLTLTVGAVARACRSFTLNIQGGMDRDRFLNSQTLTALQRLSAGFGVTFDVPSGDNASQFWASGIAGAALTAVFVNASSATLTIDIANMKWEGDSPVHAAGSEGFLTISAQALRVGTATPVTITLNPGS